MAQSRKSSRKAYTIGIYVTSVAAAWLLLILQFVLHRAQGFVNDDIWYCTNLVTGEPLSNLHDIWESQVWHFFNWGGRNVTHSVLQLVLMQGEFVADILNILMTVFLSLMICCVADAKSIPWMVAANSMFLAMNANPFMNITWQSGSVNYLYSSGWILLFLYQYLRAVDGKKEVPLIWLWILPLGLMSGWSNENMGPACAVVVFGCVLYQWVWQKKKPAVWMWEGLAACLLGCIPLILAPGNFIRSSLIDASLLQKLMNNVREVYVATVDYLFVPFAVAFFLCLLRVCGQKKQLAVSQWAIAAFAVLAHGAMVLSPTYPSRATFGVMMLLVTLILSIMRDMLREVRGEADEKTKLMLGGVKGNSDVESSEASGDKTKAGQTGKAPIQGNVVEYVIFLFLFIQYVAAIVIILTNLKYPPL